MASSGRPQSIGLALFFFFFSVGMSLLRRSWRNRQAKVGVGIDISSVGGAITAPQATGVEVFGSG